MDIGRVGMVGNGNGLVPEDLDSTNMFGGNQGAVTEEGVRVKINHIFIVCCMKEFILWLKFPF
jgi:succinyl-CoA synthetase beta subunit